ncbi:hypothetical protein [Krasilnikovia sp. MM14-A1259]|uniref:hypothetical protein n=1 Tax=Krasilnikovia sp. MM14-A1259 TaxID=3373539 RepID=UPI00399D4348
MRLSPKSIFIGVVLVGLPFAVAAGWALGPSPAGPVPASAPAGNGVIGTAPSRIATPESVTAVEWPERPSRTAAPTVSRTPRRAVVSAPVPATSRPRRARPSMTVTPPAPADPTVPAITASASPSPSTPAGLGAGGLVSGS